MTKVEYREGPKVAKEFEKAMTILFRTPKAKIERKQSIAATLPKPKKSDKD